MTDHNAAAAQLDHLRSISAAMVADRVLTQWLPHTGRERERIEQRAYIWLALNADRMPRVVRRLANPSAQPMFPLSERRAGQWKRGTMTVLLKGSSYLPSRGGHAPGDVRDAFLEALDIYVNREVGAAEPMVELREQQVSLCQLCGLLWNCTDILPGFWWDTACGLAEANRRDWPRSRTYGATARWLKAMNDNASQQSWRCAEVRMQSLGC